MLEGMDRSVSVGDGVFIEGVIYIIGMAECLTRVSFMSSVWQWSVHVWAMRVCGCVKCLVCVPGRAVRRVLV